MNTDPFTDKISLWLDHELDATEVAELQTHLVTCSTCRQAYQVMQRLDGLFREAAAQGVAPAPGFAGRFEARLAQQQAAKSSRLWLGVTALFLGTLAIIALCSALIAVSVRAEVSMLGVNLLYLWLADFIRSANTLGVWVSLGGSLLRACLITMNQPLFWASAVAAAGLAWLWVRLLKSVYRRASATVEMLLL
jgi:anti-sigma factor RsiW